MDVSLRITQRRGIHHNKKWQSHFQANIDIKIHLDLIRKYIYQKTRVCYPKVIRTGAIKISAQLCHLYMTIVQEQYCIYKTKINLQTSLNKYIKEFSMPNSRAAIILISKQCFHNGWMCDYHFHMFEKTIYSSFIYQDQFQGRNNKLQNMKIWIRIDKYEQTKTYVKSFQDRSSIQLLVLCCSK